ncbi:GRIP and coiled-coil domain-containing protein 2 isoform 1-T1 [Pholidichthys leucotaenia]
MEDPEGTGPEPVAPSPGGAPKSKLDTLSKDDLIKFAKKQMAGIQKMKSRCTDLEKEVESLKQQSKDGNSGSDDSSLMQVLTERMDALLMEKAETQQILALARKELEKTKHQAKEELAALKGELELVIEDHQNRIKTLEKSIEESNSKHQEEVAQFQKLLEEREANDRELESEREKERRAESAEEAQRCLEAQLESLQAELRAIQDQNSQKVAELQENHQKELTEAQQEVENLREELAQKNQQHEEELKALVEDYEIERDRLLLLQEELTEQLALKDSYLQDVKEEDEEGAISSGIAKMLELSTRSQADSSHGDAEETGSGRLKAALDELQAQNTMLHDELTLLSNVKAELETELERLKEEFQMEREELEFKINELQMAKDSVATEAVMVLDPEQEKVHEEAEASLMGQTLAGQNEMEQDGSTQYETLSKDRDSTLTEWQYIKDMFQSFEKDQGEKINDSVMKYKTMKERYVQDLHDKVEQLNQERDELLVRLKEVTEEKNSVKENAEEFKLMLENSSVTEQALTCELKKSVEELTRRNEEVLSQLEMKEKLAQDLTEWAKTLTEERGKLEDLLNLREEEMKKLSDERAKEIEKLLEDRDKEALLLKEEKDVEMQNFKKDMEAEMKHLKKERETMEESLKEELGRREETIAAMDVTLKELSAEKAVLHQKMEDALSGLSRAQEENELLGSKLTALQSQLELETSEKQQLDAKLISVREEADQTSATIRALEQSQLEVLKKSTEEVEELRERVYELEEEKNLLRSSLEEAQGERSDEVRDELQARISDLEQERNLLRKNLEEVEKDAEGLQKDLQDMKSAIEKVNEENHKLHAHIFLTKEEDKGEMENKMEKESRELREQLSEKESVILQLRSEVVALQESITQSAASETNTASESAEKTALLEKEIKQKDEKINKIKAVAVKAKKELDASKKEALTLKDEVESLKAERDKMNSSMKDIIHGAEGYKNLQIDYDRQTEQLDKEREKVEAAERQIAELTKRLSSAVTQTETLSSEKGDLLAGMETMRGTVKQLEAKNQELQKQSANLDRELLAEKTMKEQKIKDLSSAMKEVDELTAKLRKQQQQSQQTAQELEQLRKEAQQSSLLDMEMADYERLVKELNGKLSEKDERGEELKAEINALTKTGDTLKEEIEALKSQLDQEEEKSSKMKQLLVNTKKDLADAKKQESLLMVQQASLTGELEAHQQQLESSKIEVCELTAERHRLQEQLKSAVEQQQRSCASLQQRIHSLQQESDTSKAELLATASEFESYKVRVHNVLKQQKSKTTQNENDTGKLQREQLSCQVEQLKARLTESQQSLHTSTAELQQLQAEHDTLLERHNKILQETVSKEADLRERLLSLQSENMALRSDLSQAQADLSSQVETQRQTYREQLRKLQDDHRATVETLQGQLMRVEEQLFNLQSQSSSMLIQSSRKSLTSDIQRRSADQSQVALTDLQSMAREEGEGMETAETDNSSPAPTPLSSLEQLLTSPDPKQEPFAWSVEASREELGEKLNTATRSMEHMNSLLHETEATNAVLMEQITLLKSEVRRLERNQERERSVANLEYLKNVLLQFIFLRSGSERQALLPVIHTMLQLSPEEKSKLAAIAHGEEEGARSRGSGWTSYLHSWSGIR